MKDFARSGADLGRELGMREFLFVFATAVILCVMGSVVLGQDSNWDQRNYHYYIPYAFLHGRLETDIAAAQLQSWLNPFGSLPSYVLIRSLEPVFAGAALGALSAVPLSLVYVLARTTTSDLPKSESQVVSFVAATIAGTGAVFIAELGTTFVDVLWSAPFLGSLIALARDSARDPRTAHRNFALAGLLAGMSTGLKLTFAAYFLSLVLALLLTRPRSKAWVTCYAALGVGFIAGFSATAGFWAYKMWSLYGNPVFPFFNAIFNSPWYPSVNVSDTRFIPRTFLEAASYPFQAAVDPVLHPGAEVPYRDGRYAVVVLVTACASWMFTRRRLPLLQAASAQARGNGVGGQCSTSAPTVAFFFLSAAANLAMFGVLRYAALLELLSGVGSWILLRSLASESKRALVAFALICVGLVLTTIPADWGRVAYGTRWIDVAVPSSVSIPGTLYLGLGEEPKSYVLPHLSASPGPMIKLHGNFRAAIFDSASTPWHTAVLKRLRDHDGPIRTVSVRPVMESDKVDLALLGIRIVEAECERFDGNYESFWSCPCRKHDGP